MKGADHGSDLLLSQMLSQAGALIPGTLGVTIWRRGVVAAKTLGSFEAGLGSRDSLPWRG